MAIFEDRCGYPSVRKSMIQNNTSENGCTGWMAVLLAVYYVWPDI